MATDVTIVAGSWGKWWPCFVAGFFGPLLGLLFARWLPFHFAFGLAFFVTWFVAGLVLAGRSAPKWELPRWLAAALIGAAAGLCGAALSFVFPWG